MFEALLTSILGQRRQTYAQYLKSKKWQRKAEECKRLAGYRCALCNRGEGDGVRLEAHHRTYDRIFNERQSDLTCLCAEHHRWFEKNAQHRPAGRESGDRGQGTAKRFA